MPQSKLPPQPSPMVPQYWPPLAAVQVPFVQLAGMHTLFALHTWPEGQSPQGKDPPQPSPTVPQNWLPLLPQVRGMQPAFTQTLFVQLVPAAQVPQSKPWPQPSPMVPQNWVVAAEQVAATQLEPPTHRLLVQVQSALQFMPQSMVPLQPSPMDPQYWPPSGVQETPVLQLEPSIPASGITRTVPLPAVLVCPLPLLLPAPDAPVAPPALRVRLPEGDPLEQLATAITAAR
jgi:hypothetical protein